MRKAGNASVLGRASATMLGVLLAGQVHAAVNAMVVVEPTARKAGLIVSQQGVEAGLGKVLGQPVSLATSEDLTDMMRATRSGGYELFIGPAQIAASALSRGYELLGATQGSEPFVLVVRADVADLGALRGRRLYLPQQDSIYTYMARGLLTQGGLSMQDLRVAHERYPQAGLAALLVGSADATVVRQSEWKDWQGQHGTAAKVLASSEPVPGGFSVVVKKDMPADARARLAQWFAAVPASTGLTQAKFKPEMQEYKRVADLGHFTPTQLPGVTRVTAREAQQLQAKGAVLVDTRIEKEYSARHIRGALWVPYVEKSLKDVAFNPAMDDFSALDKADKLKPSQAVIFACNGAECWKSYKAAKQAQAKGFKTVYWLRGGLPEWEAEGLPVESAGS
ncbi:rhodanese-like domain-containing protein [Pelomonas sp. APW6]|uniref:Rhodanese-like domain-containing protein n=1 Tax=Roseateles subflavus TaxID=3053353 RepID=A0ABT7LGV1_9BURK|nr:rhodanese-like domain-containing protein [Pelomonas sp. APW6]MDL5032086.1 rhodanese-like domain-containing protein [Pelomonas sp. APW6]